MKHLEPKIAAWEFGTFTTWTTCIKIQASMASFVEMPMLFENLLVMDQVAPEASYDLCMWNQQLKAN